MGLFDRLDKAQALAEPVNPPPEAEPVTSAVAEPRVIDLTKTQSTEPAVELNESCEDRLARDLELCRAKGYDVETYLRLTYNL
jgi:hypothetical protein